MWTDARTAQKQGRKVQYFQTRVCKETTAPCATRSPHVFPVPYIRALCVHTRPEMSVKNVRQSPARFDRRSSQYQRGARAAPPEYMYMGGRWARPAGYNLPRPRECGKAVRAWWCWCVVVQTAPGARSGCCRHVAGFRFVKKVLSPKVFDPCVACVVARGGVSNP